MAAEKKLMDVKGRGKPQTFDNVQVSWSTWNRSMVNFVMGVLGDEIQVVTEHAAATKSELKKGDIEKLRKCRRAR